MIMTACFLICTAAAEPTAPIIPAIPLSTADKCAEATKVLMDTAWIRVWPIAVRDHEIVVKVTIGKFTGNLTFPDSDKQRALRSGAFFVQLDNEPKLATDLVPRTPNTFSLVFVDVPSGQHKITVGLVGGGSSSQQIYQTKCVSVP